MTEMDRLVEVMRRLRAPDGCPWDREQTHESLKKNLIEEAAEYLDAVDAADDAAMREELGDVLMQVVLHAVIAEERNAFDFQQVTKDIADKMVRRHPHVFGSEKVDSVSDVLTLWETVKKEEKQGKTPVVSILARIPRSLPGLMRAEKMQKKAAKVSFDWQDEAGVRAKLAEEFQEVQAAFDSGNDVAIDEELFGSAAADYVRAAELDERKNTLEERLMEIYEELEADT